MNRYLKFLVLSVIGMMPYIASAQSDCGGGIIQSIKNNWNNAPNKIAITTDNSIPRASNRYLDGDSVIIDTNYGAARTPYADIIETVTAAYSVGSYVHFYQTFGGNNCIAIDRVTVCRSAC